MTRRVTTTWHGGRAGGGEAGFARCASLLLAVILGILGCGLGASGVSVVSAPEPPVASVTVDVGECEQIVAGRPDQTHELAACLLERSYRTSVRLWSSPTALTVERQVPKTRTEILADLMACDGQAPLLQWLPRLGRGSASDPGACLAGRGYAVAPR